jgi:predicted PurR-regulated permease PerM
MNKRLIPQRAFFFGMVAILVILTLILVWRFTRPILLAVAVVIILKPLYNWLLSKKWINGNERRATAVTILIFILLIAIPVILIIGGAISQAALLFSELDIEDINFSLRELNTWLEGALSTIVIGNFQIDDFQFSESIAQVISWISQWLGELLISLGRSIPGLFTGVLVVLVILYVLLPRYQRPGKQDILDIVPFPPEITQLFLDKVDLMIKAMFKGTFVIAITQGLAMGLVLLIAGVPYVLFLTVISMFLSLVPLLGVSLVAWPVGIILIIGGDVWQGIFVIAAFILVVANIDTVLRPYLIPKGAQLNPALIILSVLGGLSVMGLIGALYGPVVMILLVTSLDVYSKYMLRSDLETLERQGRIDLKELGLVPQDDQEEQKIGEMFVTALKNVSARFQKEPSSTEEDDRIP